MSHRSVRPAWRRAIPVVTLLVAASASLTPAHAQGTTARAERADPLDAQARVPAVTHRSALAVYRRLGEDTRIPWKDANETVNRIGGWRAYTREAQQPDPPASAPAGRATPSPSSSSSPSPSGQAPAHGGPMKH